MHDAVADGGRQLAADLLAQELDDLVERAGTPLTSSAGHVSIDEDLPVGVLWQQAGTRADAVDLPL